MHKQTLRPAIAMIELIFALVIMAIVLMSAPMLISTSIKSSFVVIQQEAINEAAARISMVMGYHWDEQNTNEEYLDNLLHTTTVYTDLDEFNSTGYRKGTPFESYRSFIRDDGVRTLNASASGTFGSGVDAGDTSEDDIDDFDGNSDTLTLIDTEAGNVETTTINIATTVAYSSDTVTGGYNQSAIVFDTLTTTTNSTNIKLITTTLTSTSGVDELNKTIQLRAFSCNIGGYILEEKDDF